jgi:hypothetical protein
MQIKLIAPVAALDLAAASLFAQTAQIIAGTVSDAMCGAHHTMKDATAAQCTRECIKQGSDYALINYEIARRCASHRSTPRGLFPCHVPGDLLAGT